MAFAEKLEQTGTMGEDPFSRRRLQSSLGGQTILDASFLALAPAYGLKSVDMSLGFLALMSVLGLWATKSWLGRSGTTVLVIILAFYWLPSANITSHYFAMAGIVAVLYFVTERMENWTRGDLIILGIIFGTALTLKTTTTTFLLLLVPLIGWALLSSDRLFFLRKGATLSTVILLVLAPFSLSLWLSNGTFLYPFLGEGFHSAHMALGVAGETSVAQLLIEFAKVPFRRPEMLVALVVTLLSITFGRNKAHVACFYAFCAGTLSLLVPFLSSSGSFDATRYSAPIFFPLLLASIFLLAYAKVPNVVVSLAATLTLVTVSTSPYLTPNPRVPLQFLLYETPAWLSEQEYVADLARVGEIQALLPPGTRVLVNGPTGYLWDFRTNEILIGDIPGSASPPPGLDLQADTDDISSFLKNSGIDYLVVDYTGHFEVEVHSHMLENDYPPQWRNDMVNQFRLYEVALDLQRICGSAYDDGTTLVVTTKCD